MAEKPFVSEPNILDVTVHLRESTIVRTLRKKILNPFGCENHGHFPALGDSHITNMDGKKTAEEHCDACPRQRKWLWTVWLLPVALPVAALWLLSRFTNLLCCGCYGERFLVVLIAAYLGILLANLIRKDAAQ